MNKVSREILYELYIIRGKPMHEIAEELGIAVGTVYNYLNKYEIQTRNKGQAFEELKRRGWKYPQSAKETISKSNKGRKFSEETRKKMSIADKEGGIGHKKKRSDGYICIYFPDHPKSTKDGYIMEHDLIMECLIGRHLGDNEVVHHKNKIRDDNRKENLQLMTKSEHASLHLKERWNKNESLYIYWENYKGY